MHKRTFNNLNSKTVTKKGKIEWKQRSIIMQIYYNETEAEANLLIHKYRELMTREKERKR